MWRRAVPSLSLLTPLALVPVVALCETKTTKQRKTDFPLTQHSHGKTRVRVPTSYGSIVSLLHLGLECPVSDLDDGERSEEPRTARVRSGSLDRPRTRDQPTPIKIPKRHPKSMLSLGAGGC